MKAKSTSLDSNLEKWVAGHLNAFLHTLFTFDLQGWENTYPLSSVPTLKSDMFTRRTALRLQDIPHYDC